MEGIIKVSPSKLTNTASDFSTQGDTMNSVTEEMMQLITALSSVWEGEASVTYINKFKSLQEDINKITRMVKEHATDLTDMAQTYTSSDQSASGKASSLRNNVIV